MVSSFLLDDAKIPPEARLGLGENLIEDRVLALAVKILYGESGLSG